MRDGAEGDAVAAAMDLLIRYGYALDAERLCDIRNVAGTMTQPSPVKARLVAEGGWDKAFAVINLDSDLDLTVPQMRVPTCQLQHGFGPDSVDIVPYPKANVELQDDAEAFYGRHGVNILATCTPYQVGNLPMRGEHCAWMESSAVIYANSVLGARTNCEGIASTGAASLTGKIPCWGNHLEENRHGTHLISVAGLHGGVVPGLGDARLLRRRGRGRGPPGDHRRHLPARPDRAQALRRGRGDLRRRRAVPHPGDHAGGGDGRGGVRRRGRGARGGRRTGRRSGGRCTRRSTRSGRPPTSTSCCSAARTPRSTRSGRPPRCSTASGCRRAPSCGSWRRAR